MSSLEFGLKTGSGLMLGVALWTLCLYSSACAW